MRTPVNMVANHAVIQNGLLQVQGGGWDNYLTSVFPVLVSGTYVLQIEADTNELGSIATLTVDVSDEDGRPLGSTYEFPLPILRGTGDPNSPLRIPIVAPFAAVVDRPRRLTVRAQLDGVPIGDCSFSVIPVPTPE